MEELIKKYVVNGGELFTIKTLSYFRTSGDTIINLTNGNTFFVSKIDLKIFKDSGLQEEIDCPYFRAYLLDRLESFIKNKKFEYEKNKKFITRFSVTIND